MATGKSRIKRRVWVGLIAGLAVVGASAWWVRSRQTAPVEAGRVAQPFVQLAGAGTATRSRILQEKAELMDPTPLFFPTAWNYGQRPLHMSRQRQPGEVFGSFAPRIDFGDQNIKLYGVEPVAGPEKLADVLVQGNEAPFAGMGQVDQPQSTLSVRSGYLEIKELGGKESIVSQSLTGIVVPRTDFEPIEFLVVVGSAGLIGEPILTSGSGWDEVDAFFRTYLVKTYHLGERLSPGRYRIVVGA